MSKAWMPFYVGDYRADTAHLSCVEHGAYLQLIMHYWTAGGLPDDDKKLARIVGLSMDEWQEIRDTLADLFCAGWTHKRIDRELSRAKEKSDRAAASAAKRWSDDGKPAQSNRNANAMRTHSDGNASDSNPDAMLPQSQSQSQSHTPSLRSGETRERASSAEFDQFWSDYPHKVGKAAAVKAWERARKSADVAAIMAGLRRYANKTDDRPWCNPATWLNQERWNDQPAPQQPRAGPAKSRSGGFHEILRQFDEQGKPHDDQPASSEPEILPPDRSGGSGNAQSDRGNEKPAGAGSDRWFFDR